MRPRRTGARKVAAITVAGLLSASGVSWIVDYTTRNDGVRAWTSSSPGTCLPAAVVNATGDVGKYSYLLPSRQFSFFSVGPAALADGVHDFMLSPVDAVTSNGNMSPAFAAWVRGRGREIASFPSDVYGSVELWQVGSGPFDAQADTVDIPAGVFINTTGSRCGGFRVKNSPRKPAVHDVHGYGWQGAVGPSPLERFPHRLGERRATVRWGGPRRFAPRACRSLATPAARRG